MLLRSSGGSSGLKSNIETCAMPRNFPVPFTMPLSRLALRRRSLAEQKAIRMIRGERSRREGDPAAYASQFKRLRTLAAKNGLAIRVPGAPYLGEDEMRILAWLAHTQRGRILTHSFHDAPELTPIKYHLPGNIAPTRTPTPH